MGDRVRASHVDSAEEIAAGSGAVVRIGGEQRAVYRDETGTVHALSARCTHLGCVVHYNDAEPAWECPCHGSRFAVNGAVIRGPVNEPLEHRDIEGRSSMGDTAARKSPGRQRWG